MSRADRLILGSIGLAAIVGIGISIYLTIVHYQGGNPVCSTTGVVDCAKVVNSPYGQIFGTSVPTSAAGIGWFLVSLVLVALQWCRPESVPLARLALAWGVLGILTILYLIYVELVRINAICAWCTGAHTLVFLTLLLVIARHQMVTSPYEEEEDAAAG